MIRCADLTTTGRFRQFRWMGRMVVVVDDAMNVTRKEHTLGESYGVP